MDEPPEEQAISTTANSLIDIDIDSVDIDSFDIISEEEIARVKQPFYSTAPASSSFTEPWSLSPASSSSTLISNRASCSSLSSTGTDHSSEFSIPSVISGKGLSFLFRSRNVTSVCEAELQLEPPAKKIPPQLTEEEMTSSTTRIWYIIQLQGHYNHGLEETEEEGWYLQPPPKYRGTMENSSGKQTNWIHSLLHIPEKIKQHQADKHRFNVNRISPQAREELKHLYVY